MSCCACTKKYSFFCKEFGCPNCGYSFCTKCLKKEIEVPRKKNAKLKVCLKCFEKLKHEKLPLDELHIDIPDQEFFSIDEPIEAPILQPIHPNRYSETDDGINENLDSVISKRLAGLKNVSDSSNTIPSDTDTDMANRLASLKGVPYKDYSKSDILLKKDSRTDQEKINDILKQFIEENGIDNGSNIRTDPILEIEQRLAALRGTEMTSSPTIPNDESTSVKKIVQRYLDEAKLPDALISEEEKELIADLPLPSKDTEELPWCTICNDDAVFRCLGCDGDLFCRNCFKECHDDDEDFREHKTQTYSKPQNFKENHF